MSQLTHLSHETMSTNCDAKVDKIMTENRQVLNNNFFPRIISLTYSSESTRSLIWPGWVCVWSCEPHHFVLAAGNQDLSQEVMQLAFVPKAYWACLRGFSHRAGVFWRSHYSHYSHYSPSPFLLLLFLLSTTCCVRTMQPRHFPACWPGHPVSTFSRKRLAPCPTHWEIAQQMNI